MMSVMGVWVGGKSLFLLESGGGGLECGCKIPGFSQYASDGGIAFPHPICGALK